MLLTLPFLTFAQQAPQGQRGQQDQQMRQKQEMKKDRMEEHIPNLTDEQKKSIEEIRIATMKDMQPLKNELGEKEAKFRTLNSADKPDMDAINKQIDEIAVIKTKIAKREAKAHQDVRALLDEDQRIKFDMHHNKRRMEKGKQKAHY